MSVNAITTGGKRRWKVRWREGGKQRSKTFDRNADAKLFDAEVTRKRQTRELTILTGDCPTLKDYASRWWEEYAEPNLAQTTLSIYAVQLDLRISPELGGYQLREITPAMVQRLLTRLTKEGVGDATTVKTATVLQSIMRKALLDGYIDRNPVQAVRKPSQRRKREPEIIAPSSVEYIRSKLSLRDATIVSVLAYAGLRPESEMTTLTWEQVGERAVRIDASKTGRRRYVRLMEPLAEDLDVWRLNSASTGLVFPTTNGAWTRNTWKLWERRIWKPVARDAGLRQDTRARDLRGSFASLLIWEGMSVVEAAEQHGNSAATFLRDYAGVFAEFNASNRLSAGDAIRAARTMKVRPQSVLKIVQGSKTPEPSSGLEPETPSLPWKCSTN